MKTLLRNFLLLLFSLVSAYQAKADCTIPAGTTINASTITATSSPVSTACTGTLYVYGTLNMDANLTLPNVNTIVVDGANAKINFAAAVRLSLPTANSNLVLTNGGSITATGACNNNTEIYLGGVRYAACTGGGNVCYTFSQLNASGGTVTAQPSSNAPICTGTTLNLIGAAIGTGTITYSWAGTGPGGYNFSSATQSPSISGLAEGIYTFTLTASVGSGACLRSNSKAICVAVFPTMTAPVVNSGFGAIVVTPPTSYAGFTIEYSFDGGSTWGANTPPTADNCTGYTIMQRYVLNSTCQNNAAGSSVTCATSSTVVRPVDNTAPMISCPANITLLATGANCTATATLAAPTVTENCSYSTTNVRSDNLALTAAYPIGTTTVTRTVTDIAGHQASCTQTVTVEPQPTATNDSYVVTDPEPVSIGNVLSNDAACGGAAVPNVSLSIITPASDPNLTINLSTGAVVYTGNISTGTYTITYEICDAAYPSRCSTAVATINVLTVLPAKGLELTAVKYNGGHLLKWQTLQEQNTRYFQVQVSADGKNFEPLSSKIAAAGNSSIKANYSLQRSGSFSGTWYYRISLVDADGQVTYSNIAMVTTDQMKGILIWPNPVKQSLNVTMPAAGQYSLKVYKSNGQLVYNEQKVLVGSNLRYSRIMSNLAAGSYLIQVVNLQTAQSFVQKFLVQP